METSAARQTPPRQPHRRRLHRRSAGLRSRTIAPQHHPDSAIMDSGHVISHQLPLDSRRLRHIPRSRPLARAQSLGDIDFPTPAPPPPRLRFLEGVKALHSFEFDDAAEAFREARQHRPQLRPRLLGRSPQLQPPSLGSARSLPSPADPGTPRAHRRRPPRQGAHRKRKSLRRRRQPALLFRGRQARP